MVYLLQQMTLQNQRMTLLMKLVEKQKEIIAKIMKGTLKNFNHPGTIEEQRSRVESIDDRVAEEKDKEMLRTRFKTLTNSTTSYLSPGSRAQWHTVTARFAASSIGGGNQTDSHLGTLLEESLIVTR